MKFAWSLCGFLPDLHGQFISITSPWRTVAFSLGPRDPKGLTAAKYRGLRTRPISIQDDFFTHKTARARRRVQINHQKPNSQSKIVWTVWRPVTRIYTSIFVASPPLTLGTDLPAWILYGAMECPQRFLMGLTAQRNKTVRNSLFRHNSQISLQQIPADFRTFLFKVYIRTPQRNFNNLQGFASPKLQWDPLNC